VEKNKKRRHKNIKEVARDKRIGKTEERRRVHGK
jgi:hypothetical protein